MLGMQVVCSLVRSYNGRWEVALSRLFLLAELVSDTRGCRGEHRCPARDFLGQGCVVKQVFIELSLTL